MTDSNSKSDPAKPQSGDQGKVPFIGASLIPLILRAQGIETVPCLQGGQIMPTMDRVSRVLKPIFFKTEQGLTFSLIGMAKAGLRPYVGIVTSGPGGLNTVTALADATRDCAPIGIIAGQVPTNAIGTDAFQGIDITEVARSVTKSSRLIESTSQLTETIPRDLGLSASGKPGSVLWDVPKDVQFASLEEADIPTKINSYQQFVERTPLDTDALDQAIELLYESTAPVFMAGYGLALANVGEEFQELLNRTEIPVVHTLPGKAGVDSRYELNLGMLGMHGLYPASAAAHHSDLIFSLGARYDDRAVGNPDRFAPAAKGRKALIHVDTAQGQFLKSKELVPHKHCVLGDAGDVVRYLLDHLDVSRLKIGDWQRQVRSWQHENPPPPSRYAHQDELDIVYLLKSVDQITSAECPEKIFVTDVGNHQMWSAQRLRSTGPNGFLTSAGLGTIGSGIPQGIGAQLAQPDRPVIVLQGDESYFCCCGELRTAARYQIPIKVLVINNGGQAIVRQWTTNMFGGNNVGVIDHVEGVARMDFVKNAQSYGIEAERVSAKREFADAFKRMLKFPGPYVLDCVVPHEDCYPWIRPGTGFSEILTQSQ